MLKMFATCVIFVTLSDIQLKSVQLLKRFYYHYYVNNNIFIANHKRMYAYQLFMLPTIFIITVIGAQPRGMCRLGLFTVCQMMSVPLCSLCAQMQHTHLDLESKETLSLPTPCFNKNT